MDAVEVGLLLCSWLRQSSVESAKRYSYGEYISGISIRLLSDSTVTLHIRFDLQFLPSASF